MSKRYLSRASLVAVCLGWILGIPDLALAGSGLTAQEQAIVCKLSGTCEQGDPEAAAAGGNDSKTVGGEATFTVFRGTTTTPAQKVAMTAPSQGPKGSKGPNLYPVGGGRNLQSSGSNKPKPANWAPDRAHQPSGSGRANALDIHVLFSNASTDLNPGGMKELVAFAHALQSPALASGNFVIEGHTNSVGAREFNIDLSQRRAQAVVDYLVKLGVSQSRLEAKGFGSEKLRISDRPTDGRNRRVEIVKAN